MKTLLLSVLALTVAAAPVFGEDEDQPKQPKRQAPPQKQVNTVPKSYTPRVQQQLTAKTQALQNKPNVNRTYTPKTYTPNPNVQSRTRNITPLPNQDAPRTVTPRNPTVTSNNWQNQNQNRNRNR